jgi:hypothetical protein
MTTGVVGALMKQPGPLLEFVRAAITAEDLRKGVDLLRTRPNEVSLIQGMVSTNQLWQRVNFHLQPQSMVGVTLGVGDEVMNFRQGGQRLDRIRLVKAGLPLRAIVHDPNASELTLANLEIFGWEVPSTMLPQVEEAIRLLEAS